MSGHSYPGVYWERAIDTGQKAVLMGLIACSGLGVSFIGNVEAARCINSEWCKQAHIIQGIGGYIFSFALVFAAFLFVDMVKNIRRARHAEKLREAGFFL
ncbi:hypothetical protein [Corynebacterium aquilae]|uniref:Uncharacterized protein n=1 Tax=Corynebacterium aquilae DSM 44791 TaxID=1431546 RepID=A0A1L7CHK9_9CORY|nr:hypothetical protein [Corynebacterium aquilae]APT85332.1 hypothetical protein CAQU_09950 [Corynebacterium aquilae DSM 44791]